MVEWLAMPPAGADPMAPEVWAEAFALLGHPARVAHEGPGVAWIEVPALRMRGYMVLEQGAVEAINFELSDSEAALTSLRAAASRLRWELYQEDDDEEDDTA